MAVSLLLREKVTSERRTRASTIGTKVDPPPDMATDVALAMLSGIADAAAEAATRAVTAVPVVDR
jgi:hypothetical protein